MMNVDDRDEALGLGPEEGFPPTPVPEGLDKWAQEFFDLVSTCSASVPEAGPDAAHYSIRARGF